MEKALEDCILAYEVNGEALPPEHGHPIRLLVPGWYGVNSVKWVTELHVTETMVHGEEWADRDGDDFTQWQQSSYRIHPEGVEPESNATISTYDTWDQLESDEIDHPYTFDENVKSTIGRPADGATVSPREDGVVEIVGVAWAGDDEVTTIEISTDGGDSWRGEFVGPNYDCAWRLFRDAWEPSPGTYELVSRATDERGRRQPRADRRAGRGRRRRISVERGRLRRKRVASPRGRSHRRVSDNPPLTSSGRLKRRGNSGAIDRNPALER